MCFFSFCLVQSLLKDWCISRRGLWLEWKESPSFAEIELLKVFFQFRYFQVVTEILSFMKIWHYFFRFDSHFCIFKIFVRYQFKWPTIVFFWFCLWNWKSVVELFYPNFVLFFTLHLCSSNRLLLSILFKYVMLTYLKMQTKSLITTKSVIFLFFCFCWERSQIYNLLMCLINYFDKNSKCII